MCDQEVKEKVKDVEYEIVSDKFCVKLSESDINVGQAIEFVTSSASSSPCPFGAVNLFLGITRGVEDGHELSHLYYEAYHVMALNIMRNIVNQVMKTHLNNGSDDGVDSPDGRVFLCHRLGAVSSGQSSILVCVSSRHRQASHLAVMEILNQGNYH